MEDLHTPLLPTRKASSKRKPILHRPRKSVSGKRTVWLPASGQQLANCKPTFCSNQVITSKYTTWNFLPKFLFETFQLSANAYFLLICILQVIPGITNTRGVPTQAFPLLIVVIVDAVFQVLEDRKRHQADAIANEMLVKRVNRSTKGIEEIQAQHIQVGDILIVENHQSAAADMILLQIESYTSDNNASSRGFCYVETRSLDGETNLKLREALHTTSERLESIADCFQLHGKIDAEQPNGAVHKFNGVLSLYDFDSTTPDFDLESNRSLLQEPITISNALLRGCTVRNTKYVIGIVINTGHDTKIMQSAIDCPSKTSDIDHRINHEFLVLIICLLIFCGSAATIAAIYNEINFTGAWYLPLNNNSIVVWFATFLRFFLILSNMIPISLYVTLDIVKTLQKFFMQSDLAMYDVETDTPCSVRTMALNEELGQIAHVFTDKTGTLTCNVMNFRKCSINGVTYGNFAVPQQSVRPFVNFYDEKFQTSLQSVATKPGNKIGPWQTSKEHEFLLHLSLCHSIIPEVISSTETQLSASSPDEQALVQMAAAYGYEFINRSPGKALVRITALDSTVEFDVLDILEFSSARKRMSVIVRDTLSKEILLLTKGADSVIFPRLAKTEHMSQLLKQTHEQLVQYTIEGLRTLVMAKRVLSSAVYEKWSKDYHSAINSLEELQKRSSEQPNRIDELTDELEQNLELLGATAIEDRLQEGAANTIEMLRQAGICVWMLTGDHPKTAANIALSSKLIGANARHVTLTSDNIKNSADFHHQFTMQIESHRSYQQEKLKEKGDLQIALTIDGESLSHACDEEHFNDFLLLAESCDVVLACRVSPGQKADLVQMIKRYSSKPGRTLAIGDGANDVAMIQAAHVGVGISGQEGMQAANCSDYSIAQFRFLNRLLLAHGRFNYHRIALVVSYIYYKNVVLVMSQFWYSIMNGMSGQKYYNEWAVDLFNTFYTAAPIVVVGSMDMDIPAWVSEKLPLLYRSGITGEAFSRKVFWSWIISALVESFIICVASVSFLNGIEPNGSPYGMWEEGALAFTLVILVVNLKLAVFKNQWTALLGTLWVLSLLTWLASAYILSSTPLSAGWYYLFPRLLSTDVFWLALVLVPVIALSKDVISDAYRTNFSPKPVHLVQEVIALRAYAPKYEIWRAIQELLPESVFVSSKKAHRAEETTGYAVEIDPYTCHVEAEICTQSPDFAKKQQQLSTSEMSSTPNRLRSSS